MACFLTARCDACPARFQESPVTYGDSGIGVANCNSFCAVVNACFWYGSSCGTCGSSDFSAGRPQPLLARSSAGGPAMKYSMNFHAASLCLDLAGIHAPWPA